MRDPFAGYDQWKTASPYDDDLDVVEEGYKLLAEAPVIFDDWDGLNEKRKRALLKQAYDTLEAALQYIDENH